MDTAIQLRNRLNADDVRSVLEVMYELESQLPVNDSRWNELRMVRYVLGKLLREAENDERNAVGIASRQSAVLAIREATPLSVEEWPTRQEMPVLRAAVARSV